MRFVCKAVWKLVRCLLQLQAARRAVASWGPLHHLRESKRREIDKRYIENIRGPVRKSVLSQAFLNVEIVPGEACKGEFARGVMTLYGGLCCGYLKYKEISLCSCRRRFYKFKYSFRPLFPLFFFSSIFS